MNSNEPALRALQIEVQFELAQAGVAVAQAMALCDRAQELVSMVTQRRESTAHGLRDIMGRPRVNPALLDAMRRLYQVEHRALHIAQDQLDAARQREQQARTALAELRNRDRSLDRALQGERRKRRLALQAREMLIADDLWLQHAVRPWS